MKSIRFGILVIALCGLVAVAAALRIGLWGSEAETLASGQEAIGDHIIELRAAMRAMLDLETGQRGYLLTGEEAYLEGYEAGRRNLMPALQKLADFYRHDPATLAKIEDLRQLAEAEQRELARTIELRRSGDLAAALGIVETGEGKRSMDAFNDKSGALLTELRRLRTDLLTTETTLIHKTIRLGAVVVVLIILLVVAAILWLSLSIRHLGELQARREREAMHVALTALPNRRYLIEWLGVAFAAAQRSGQRLALLYFDLDGFKGVNDRLGHEAGDRVLQVTAERLRAAMRGSDFVARLGGDEFVVVLSDVPDEPDLSAMISRLNANLAKAPLPEMADGEISASIGLARFPGDGASPEALLGAADRAMYAVKEGRRDRAASAPPRPAGAVVAT